MLARFYQRDNAFKTSYRALKVAQEIKALVAKHDTEFKPQNPHDMRELTLESEL